MHLKILGDIHILYLLLNTLYIIYIPYILFVSFRINETTVVEEETKYENENEKTGMSEYLVRSRVEENKYLCYTP